MQRSPEHQCPCGHWVIAKNVRYPASAPHGHYLCPDCKLPIVRDEPDGPWRYDEPDPE
jgi:hypothetical protein